MADTLITNLPNVPSPTGAEELPVNVPGSPDTDGKVVFSAMAAYVKGTIGNATASVAGLATAAQITKLDGIEALADVTDAANVGSSIHGATAKTTPIDADTVPLIDSAASNVLKKLSWANIKATLKTYFDGLYQPIATILTSLSNLTNAAGVLTNNGSGTLSYTGTTTGGMAGDDDGKLPKYFNSGWLMCNKLVATSTGNVSPAIEYGPTSIEFVESGGTFAGALQWPTITASRTLTLPNVTGTVVTTGNLAAITATGTIASGTWQGSIIAPAYLGTGSDITTKFLRGDGAWQTISGGGDALTTNPLSQFAATTSSQLAGVISDETGSGALVFANSPTLVTPALGTPASGTLTNCTGLPVSGLASFVGLPVSIQLACSDEGTALTTGTAKLTFRMPHAMTLTAVRASVGTAPTGSTLVVDINEGGTSILGTKLSIDATEKTSTTAASAATITDSALADDAEITIDIDQIGSTIAGAGLKVTLIGTRA